MDPLFYIVYGCVFGIFLLLLFFKKLLPWSKIKQAKNSPEIREQATLFSKTVGVVRQGYGSRSIGHLAFELSNGLRKDFTVDMPTYNLLRQGE